MHTVKRPKQRGFVLVTMGIAAFALLGTLGLAVDLGRTFIAKNETQAFVDAAAISATTQLDGTLAGITRAQTAVANTTNAWNLHSTSITNYTVKFATTSAGPWVAAPNPATGYVYSQVQATVPLKLYFLPGIVNQNSQNVVSLAVAGQVVENAFGRGVGPFTAVAPDRSAPNFGFDVGDRYTIQWPQYNSTRSGCSVANPARCFIRDPCEDDPRSTLSSVVDNWGSSTNGYWGYQSASDVRSLVLDLMQAMPLSVGQTIPMSNGNMAVEGVALDQRVNQDLDTVNNVVADYVANPVHNGRRLLPLPVVVPTPDATAEVVGFAAFLLISNGTPSNYYTHGAGNEAFCAIYAGPYVQGSTNPGSGSTGSYRIKLVY
ncbi:MAG: TadE/TadG family type IV pilus assembly protein [Bryobacteraceae bacterium]